MLTLPTKFQDPMNRNRSTVCAIIWFLGFASCGRNPRPENIIRNNRIAFNFAIVGQDTTAMSPFWTDDILVLTSRNFRTSGRQEYAVAFDREFKSKKDVIYIRSTDKVEVFEEWGMASEYGNWVGRWVEGDEKIEIGGSYYAKWQKVNDDWLIKAEVYTPLVCKGGSYCKSGVLQPNDRDALKNY